MLSRTAKESIKTALGVTLAYAIALAMDWDKPYWAALAVAICSLGTLGDSLLKSGRRMLGTVMAIAVSLLILSLTIQDRWWFMVALSAWLAFCAYKCTGTRAGYTWQAGGFVTAIIVVGASGSPEQAFTVAVLRAQETAMGVVVYSLVSVLLWPARSGAQLKAIARERAATQRKLFQACRRLLRAGDGAEEVMTLRTLLAQQQGQFDQLLESARADSPEIARVIGKWRHHMRAGAALTAALTNWQQGFAQLRTLDLPGLMPGADAFDDEVERRLIQIEGMLDGQAPVQAPEMVELALDTHALKNLRQFDAAAVTVDRSRRKHIESLSRELFYRVADVEGFDIRPAADTMPREALHRPAPPAFMLDPDRLAGALRVLIAVWLSYLLFVFVPDLPGGTLIVTLTASISVGAATMPQVPIRMVFRPLFFSLLFAASVHFLVLPRLDSFLTLGPLIFASIFGICYLFSDPRQMLSRVIGLSMFLVVSSISNEQTFSFLRVANVSLGAFLSVAVLFVSTYIPHEPFPHGNFLRLMRRFFRSSAWVASDAFISPTHGATRLWRWQSAFHRHEVATLPAKLPAWANFIDTKMLPGTTAAQVGGVIGTMKQLVGRMEELLATRERIYTLPLADERGTWRRELEEIFSRLSERPDAIDGDALRAALDGFLARVEHRVKQVIAEPDTRPESPAEREELYRLLDAYRGVSEALVDFARAADAIDWEPWYQPRFA